MCGPADYEALHSSILRVLGLSVVGVTGIVIHRAVRFLKTRKKKSPERSGATLAAERTGILNEAGDCGHST